MKAHVRCCLVLAAALLWPAAGFSYRLPRTVLPVHYDLTFTPHLLEETFDGTETIMVSVQEPIREIELNALEIEFKSVTVEPYEPAGGTDRPRRKQNAEIKLDPEKEIAVLSFAEPVQPGPAEIRIEYTGKLNRDLRGFYIGDTRIGGRAPGSNAGKYAASQGEATDIRRAFPSFDEPAMKATFSVRMIVDASDTAISNSAIVSDTPGPGAHQHTIQFATTPRISSYLVALAVGDLHCIKGEVDSVPLGICGLGDRSSLGGFAMDITKGVVGYFDSYYEKRYPFEKLDQIGIPDFAAGAMENPGAIIYRESALLSDPKTSSYSRRKGIASTISHEIAHMWFGDLVTMRWWDDVWLNEGFATWMTSKPLKKLHPEWGIELKEISDTTEAMDTDVLSTTRPIRANGETSREIDALFDSIAYQKTASLLRMIEAYIGEDNFRSGVNTYLRKHEWGNAESFDFLDALASVSQNSADVVMNDFVNQPGVPLVTVTETCKGMETELHLRQRRFLEGGGNGADSGRPSRWTIPICSDSDEPCRLLGEAELVLHRAGCNATTFVNRNGSGYFITEYDEPAESRLIRSLDTLTERERMAFTRDEWFLLMSGLRPVGKYLEIVEASHNERATEAVQPLLKNLQYIADHMTAAADRDAFRGWVRGFLRPVLRDLGPAAAGEPEERSLLRGNVLKALAVTGQDPESIAAVSTMAKKYLKDRNSLDPDASNAVLEAAAAVGDAALFDAITSAYRAGGTPEQERLLLYTLAEFRNPALLERTMEYALTQDVRNQDAGRLMAAAIRNPQGTQVCWKFLKERWTDVTQKLSDAGQLTLVRSTEAACDAGQQEDVKRFFAAHSVPGSERDLAQALEQMSICIQNTPAQQKQLAAWLQSPAAQDGSKKQ